MREYLTVFLVALAVTYLLVVLAREVALRFGAVAHDATLFGRHWGFELRDVKVPVRWWHGDTDALVPQSHAEHTATRIPDCELYMRPGESHLGGFAAADQVLETLDALL